MKTWKFVVEHSCTRSDSFSHAVEAFEKVKKSSAFTVEIGPLRESKPNMLRIGVMGKHVMVAVLFQDRCAVVSINAPKSLAWAESMVRGRIEQSIREMLTEAGSDFVEIREI